MGEKTSEKIRREEPAEKISKYNIATGNGEMTALSWCVSRVNSKAKVEGEEWSELISSKSGAES